MMQAVPTLDSSSTQMQAHAPSVLLRTVVIGLTAFLTVVDLFATQAILPSLTRAYRVTPAAMGFAVNASTMGMAAAGLIVSVFSQRIDRRFGILVSLALLSIPTALLAIAPDLTTFTVLRVAQGLCMASAFTLTLAYLGEECSATDAAGAFAAYITGNVASNLIGRLISAALADHLGLAWNFYFFAALNLAGAVLVYFTVARAAPMEQTGTVPPSPFAAWLGHLRNPRLRAAFGIGFCILFAFIGTFTYVNFVLVRPPLSLGPMELGFVYFVFLPSVVTTLGRGMPFIATGRGRRYGARSSSRASACRCFCYPTCRRFWSAWFSSAWGPSSPRRRRPASSAAPQPRTAGRPAASISPATSPAAWSAPRSSGRSSIGSDGRPVLPGSALRSAPRRSSRIG